MQENKKRFKIFIATLLSLVLVYITLASIYAVKIDKFDSSVISLIFLYTLHLLPIIFLNFEKLFSDSNIKDYKVLVSLNLILAPVIILLFCAGLTLYTSVIFNIFFTTVAMFLYVFQNFLIHVAGVNFISILVNFVDILTFMIIGLLLYRGENYTIQAAGVLLIFLSIIKILYVSVLYTIQAKKDFHEREVIIDMI